MRHICFYQIKEKYNYVCSLRIKDYVWTLRAKKIKHYWHFKFKYHKLEYLDIVGFYYEIGWIKDK